TASASCCASTARSSSPATPRTSPTPRPPRAGSRSPRPVRPRRRRSEMRIEQSFTVGRPPLEVFAYMVDPANLASWQTSKVSVEPLTDGPPRKGYRIRERTKIGLRQWEQVVELSEFEPGRALSTRIVEGSVPVDGRWTFQADGAGGTDVQFV